MRACYCFVIDVTSIGICFARIPLNFSSVMFALPSARSRCLAWLHRTTTVTSTSASPPAQSSSAAVKLSFARRVGMLWMRWELTCLEEQGDVQKHERFSLLLKLPNARGPLLGDERVHDRLETLELVLPADHQARKSCAVHTICDYSARKRRTDRRHCPPSLRVELMDDGVRIHDRDSALGQHPAQGRLPHGDAAREAHDEHWGALVRP